MSNTYQNTQPLYPLYSNDPIAHQQSSEVSSTGSKILTPDTVAEMTSKDTCTGGADSERPGQPHEPYWGPCGPPYSTGEAGSGRPSQFHGAHESHWFSHQPPYAPGLNPSYVGPAHPLHLPARSSVIYRPGPAPWSDPSIKPLPYFFKPAVNSGFATASRAVKEAYWTRSEDPSKMACEPTAESAVDLKTSLVKALASGAHSDLKIIIDSPVDPNGVVEISVHKVIVLPQSFVLRSMACHADKLYLHGDSPEVMRDLLYYLYTQDVKKLSVTPGESEGRNMFYLNYFADLAFAAEKYKVDNLTKLASDKIAKLVSSAECTPAAVINLVRHAYEKVHLSRRVRSIIFSHIFDSGVDQYLSHPMAEAMLDSSPRFFLDLLKYVAACHGVLKGVAKGDKLNEEVGSENIEPSSSSHTAESVMEPKMKQRKTSMDDLRFRVSESLKRTNDAMNPTTKDVTDQKRGSAYISGIPVYQSNAQSVGEVSKSSYILCGAVGFDELEESTSVYPKEYPFEIQITKHGQSGSYKGGNHGEESRVESDLPMRNKGWSENGGFWDSGCNYTSTESSEEMAPEAATEW